MYSRVSVQDELEGAFLFCITRYSRYAAPWPHVNYEQRGFGVGRRMRAGSTKNKNLWQPLFSA